MPVIHSLQYYLLILRLKIILNNDGSKFDDFEFNEKVNIEVSYITHEFVSNTLNAPRKVKQ